MKPISVFALATAVLAAACSGPRYDTRPVAGGVEGPAHRAVGIVRIEAPWYALRFVIAGKFRDLVPEYEARRALETKYFTISDDRRFGGIYLWSSRSDAEAFYTEAWRREIRERRGAEPDLILMEAPFLVRGEAVVHGKPLGERSIEYEASASLVLWTTASTEAETTTRDIASTLQRLPGLVRGAVLVGAGLLGFVALWATRDHAEQAVSAKGLAWESHFGLHDADVTLFDAPVLIDSSLRAATP